MAEQSKIKQIAEDRMKRIWENEGLTREQKRWAAFGIYELWRALEPYSAQSVGDVGAKQ